MFVIDVLCLYVMPDLAKLIYEFYDITQLTSKNNKEILLQEFNLRIIRHPDGAISFKTLFVNKITNQRILHTKIFGRDYSWSNPTTPAVLKRRNVIFDYVIHLKRNIREILP